MHIQLLVSNTCAVCAQAESVWRTLSTQRNVRFSLVHIDDPDGHTLAERLNLRTIPAVLIDGTLAGIGVQTAEQAGAILDGLCAASKG